MLDMSVLKGVSKTELRKFGLIMAMMVVAIFGLLLPWLWSGRFRPWPWWIGGAFAAFAVVWPAALKWVYIAWMKIGGVLGKINTTIILGLAYWLIFTPLGVVLRLIGKDTLAKGWREDVQTYRVPKSARADDHMERQF